MVKGQSKKQSLQMRLFCLDWVSVAARSYSVAELIDRVGANEGMSSLFGSAPNCTIANVTIFITASRLIGILIIQVLVPH